MVPAASDSQWERRGTLGIRQQQICHGERECLVAAVHDVVYSMFLVH